jgi:hypothetical protein
MPRFVGSPIDLDNQRLIDLATPTANTDATTKAYVDTAVAARISATQFDNSGGLLAVNAGSCGLYGQTSLGNWGVGASGTTAIRFTPQRDFLATGYRVFCDTAPSSSGSGRLRIFASNGTTPLTASSIDGTTLPIANTITATTTSAKTALAGTITVNSGSGSVAGFQFTAGTTYWVALFMNAAAITGQYASLYVANLFGSTITTAQGWYLSGTGTPTSLAGGTQEAFVPLIGFTG